MFRKISPLIALTLGLCAAPASAELARTAAVAPEGSTAALTLEQNRRVIIGMPTTSDVQGAAAEPGAPARDRAGAAPAAGAGKPGGRR